MKNNDRNHALQILLALVDEKISLTQSMRSQPNLSALSKEICFGVCRHYYGLEHLAHQLMHKKPKTTDLWMCILMGLYELHYLNTPDFAVVKETVDLVHALKKPWAKGLINGVLRSYCRQKDTLTHLNDDLNHPQWLMSRLKTDWPCDWQAILNASNKRAPMTLRVNQRQHSVTSYLSELTALGIKAQPNPLLQYGIILEEPTAVSNLPGFNDGAVSVQDGAAQLAATLLDLKPGLRLLDACAAPGGKTTHILESEPHLAEVWALDVEPNRLQYVQDNLNRLHLSATLKAGDGQNPESWWDGRRFDRILLDAPCSALGVIRRHPDIKLLRTPEDIPPVIERQAQLLEALWPLLSAGGRMVYATCSILPAENEQQIHSFIQKHPDCTPHLEPQDWGHFTGHGWQIFPGEHNMDGFFYSILEKKTPDVQDYDVP